MSSKKAIVVGAGIVGLAMARSLGERGYSVTVFERNTKAIGASIRNFGMIWPIGQPDGHLYERALSSKAIWKQICSEARLWYEESGSLHTAYNDLEVQVLEEFAAACDKKRNVQFIRSAYVTERSRAVNTLGLKGALWSTDEMIVEARVAIERLPKYLQEKYNTEFYFGTTVTSVDYPFVCAGKQQWQADEIFICSGADFETLYPEVFAAAPFTKCKLQMMRLVAQPDGWRLGPSLCGGLSLIHYKSFAVAASLDQLKKRFEETMPEYLRWGIHVMVSQNCEGELTVGDSHEYDATPDPFDKQLINDLIISYLKTFTSFPRHSVVQTWNGIYPKLMNGTSEYVHQPESGVTIVNGVGGAGMTLSFGLAEEIVQGRISFDGFLNKAATTAS